MEDRRLARPDRAGTPVSICLTERFTDWKKDDYSYQNKTLSWAITH
jgi:hypothetical protein